MFRMKYGMTSPVCFQRTWFLYNIIHQIPDVNLASMYETLYILKFLKFIQEGKYMFAAKIKTIY